MKISVIIPTWNEESFVKDCLKSVLSEIAPQDVIVVDGQSTDRTCELVESLGVRVLKGARNFSRQCQAGVQEVSTEGLLFLSADSRLSPGWKSQVDEVMSSPYIGGGGFKLSLYGASWWGKWIEFGGNLRSLYYQFALSDQGLFVKRDLYLSIGGFSESSLIPHAHLCRRLKEKAEFVVLPKSIFSSARKWRKEGVVQTVREHQNIFLRFMMEET